MSWIHSLQLLALVVLGGCLQNPPRDEQTPADPTRWSAEIEVFRAQDRASPPTAGCVVFVGSSSIRLWDSLAIDMQPVPVLNRGFGGSQLHDAIFFAEDLVLVHEPSLAVVFSGTNDIAGEEAKSAAQVRDLFRRLVTRLRANNGDLTICHIAITPTLAREAHLATVAETNRLIRIDCEADPNLEFVDPSIHLVDAQGRPDPQWFKDDLLHLNARGYEVWTSHIRPIVHRLFARER